MIQERWLEYLRKYKGQYPAESLKQALMKDGASAAEADEAFLLSDVVKVAVDDAAAASLAKSLKLEGFFPEFTKDQVRGVFPNSYLALYPAGFRLIAQGEDGRDLFAIYTGKVTIIRAFANKEIPMGPGDIFGEIALVKDGKRTASVLAAEPSQIFRLLYQDLQYLMANNADLAKHLEALAYERL